jgi:hypothetical protein
MNKLNKKNDRGVQKLGLLLQVVLREQELLIIFAKAGLQKKQ